VGLDIEAASRRARGGDPLRLARRRLSEAECELLAGEGGRRGQGRARARCPVGWGRLPLCGARFRPRSGGVPCGRGARTVAQAAAGASRRQPLRGLARAYRGTLAEPPLSPPLAAEPDEARRAELFVRLWTLKEAVVKAKGCGISAPPGLKGFSIGARPARRPRPCGARGRRRGRPDASARALAGPGAARAGGAVGGEPPARGSGLWPRAWRGRHSSSHARRRPAGICDPGAWQQQQQQQQQHLEQQHQRPHAPPGGGGDGFGVGGAHASFTPAAAAEAGMDLDPAWRRLTLERHAPDPCGYALLLLQPTPGHVSALCVQTPPTAAGPGSEPAEAAAAAAAGWRVRMWECVPLAGERPLPPGAARLLGAGGG
jgi:hypothetical protein